MLPMLMQGVALMIQLDDTFNNDICLVIKRLKSVCNLMNLLKFACEYPLLVCSFPNHQLIIRQPCELL